MRFPVRPIHCLSLCVTLTGANMANAGELVLLNQSNAPIDCAVDGWTVSTGADTDWDITVIPDQPFYVIPNPALGDSARIDWVECGGLATRTMGITPDSPRHPLVLNGTQTRVLNVSLYPWLPTAPGDTFNGLVEHVIATFQTAHPSVLLNAVLSQEFDIYDYDRISALAGAGGFDVLEIDMLYLGHLVSQNLVEPVANAPNILSVARRAVTIGTTEYAVPSLLCYDFLFSRDSNIHQIEDLADFLAYIGAPPTKTLSASFNGSWRTVAMYIHGYVEAYGYTNVADALVMPPDTTVIGNLVGILNSCERSDGSNPCIDDTLYFLPNGSIERQLASGEADVTVGFSEQSFFARTFGAYDNLYLSPMVWGASPQPMLYADGFVTNSSTCGSTTPCFEDAEDFIELMVDVPMREYIVEAADLPQNSSWRTLLVANADFWAQPDVIANPIYIQISAIFSTAEPLPNTIDATTRQAIYDGVCGAMQAALPKYTC